MVYLALMFGVLFGAISGFMLGEMMIFMIEGFSMDLRLILGCVGAIVGYGVAHFIVNLYERETDTQTPKHI